MTLLSRCFSNTTHATEDCVIVTRSMRTLVIKHSRSISAGADCTLAGYWGESHEWDRHGLGPMNHRHLPEHIRTWSLPYADDLYLCCGSSLDGRALEAWGRVPFPSLSTRSLINPTPIFPAQVWLFFSSSLHQEWCQGSYVSNETPHRCRKGIAKTWMRQVYGWTMNYYMKILITVTTKIMRTY